MRLMYGKAERDKAPHGRVSVFGFDPERHELEIKCRSGVVPQEDNLDEELDVTQNLCVFAKLYGIRPRAAAERIRELLDFMELGDRARASVRELSGGMKRRLVIAKALLNEPRLFPSRLQHRRGGGRRLRNARCRRCGNRRSQRDTDTSISLRRFAPFTMAETGVHDAVKRVFTMTEIPQYAS